MSDSENPVDLDLQFALQKVIARLEHVQIEVPMLIDQGKTAQAARELGAGAAVVLTILYQLAA